MSSDQADSRKAYFDTLYAKDADPWRYQTGEYEIAKRRDTLGFLNDHYASACELGCSIGVLTQELATRCDALLGLDISPIAIGLARERLRAFPQVALEVRHLPYDGLDECLDLLVLSEMLYFLDERELVMLAEKSKCCVIPGGDLLIVSYDGKTETQLSGRRSTDLFIIAASPSFEKVRFEQREHYHVCLLRRGLDRAG